MDKPAWLTSGQVAKLLEVSSRTIWRLVERGQFPSPVRYNRKLVRWNAAVIQQWMDQQQERANEAFRKLAEADEKEAKPVKARKEPLPIPPRKEKPKSKKIRMEFKARTDLADKDDYRKMASTLSAGR